MGGAGLVDESPMLGHALVQLGDVAHCLQQLGRTPRFPREASKFMRMHVCMYMYHVDVHV